MRENKVATLRELLLQKTTKELEEMLDKELHSKQVDEYAVRMILEILRRRDETCRTEISPKTEAAWRQYQEDTARRKAENMGGKRIRSPWLRAVSVAAVFVVLIFVIPSQAGAQSFWQELIRWTESFMDFFGPNDNQDRIVEYEFQTENPGLKELYDTVVAQGVTESVVPMWIPEGYELTALEVLTPTNQSIVYACFHNGDKELTYQLHIYETQVSHKFQKDQTKYREIEYDGTTYYILRNNDLWSVVWEKENIEGSVFVDCQENVLNRILDSI